MKFNEKTKATNFIYKGKILALRKDEVILPDGKESIREIVEHNGGSAIVCVKDGKILLVKQFRYAYNEELYEIPAGKLNENEDPEETAIRELEEEGGIKAERVKKIFEIYPSPGYTNEIIRVYKAEGFSQGKMHLDEDEFLSSEWVDLNKAYKMLKNGKIKDSKTIIAILNEKINAR